MPAPHPARTQPQTPATPSQPRRRLPVGAAARAAAILIAAVVVAGLVAGAGTAWADPGLVVAAPASLAEVIGRLRTLIMGLLVAVATLYLTIGGVRYLTANGDPGSVGRAKEAFKHAAFGYALAALAPLLVTLLQQIVA